MSPRDEMGGEAERVVLGAVADAMARSSSPVWLLAVSGGVDSMVMLDAAVRVVRGSVSMRERVPLRQGNEAPSDAISDVKPVDEMLPRLHVATFDHGTGPAATAAATLVEGVAKALKVPCVRGRNSAPGRTEAEWRKARWAFLRATATPLDASIVTAHTQTDQIETVFMRILRDAGPRGLSALYANSDIVRPFLSLPRSTIDQYANIRKITYISDPSNINTVHLRNRIRHDILPRIRAIDPTFEPDLLKISARAADWRTQMDQLAANFTVMIDVTRSVHIPRDQFAGYPEASLRVLWPALLARVGIVMDWRGTHRLSTFTIEGESGQSIQLSGGINVRLRRNALVFTHGIQGSRSGHHWSKDVLRG